MRYFELKYLSYLFFDSWLSLCTCCVTVCGKGGYNSLTIDVDTLYSNVGTSEDSKNFACFLNHHFCHLNFIFSKRHIICSYICFFESHGHLNNILVASKPSRRNFVAEILHITSNTSVLDSYYSDIGRKF